MIVTPLKRSLGKYKLGDEFKLPDPAARVLIKVGRLAEVKSTGLGYNTRMMTAGAPGHDPEAPYGRKADGTPRARPGRPPAAPAADAEEGTETTTAPESNE